MASNSRGAWQLYWITETLTDRFESRPGANSAPASESNGTQSRTQVSRQRLHSKSVPSENRLPQPARQSVSQIASNYFIVVNNISRWIKVRKTTERNTRGRAGRQAGRQADEATSDASFKTTTRDPRQAADHARRQ